MFKLAVTFLAVALLSTPAVLAQDEGNSTECIAACVSTNSGDCDPTDFTCLCGDSSFIENLVTCVTGQCPDAVGELSDLQAEFCSMYLSPLLTKA
ncbi:hypothetical protein CPB86DRAFT_693190 [Serendipita vermifera]|nr:hypothetical protein CPB86DRAFT_693190 [Serendipita vermifera]